MRFALELAAALLDGALDILFGHVFGPRERHRAIEARVGGRIGAAMTDGDLDFTRDLGEMLRAFFVLRALAVHDVLEFGMACHGIRQLRCGFAPPLA
mgnify:CR=1 FL=1